MAKAMQTLRNFVRYLSRGRAFRRRLPFGPQIYVTGDSQLKYLKPGRDAFDRALIDIANEFVKPGSVVWDIGANIGVFSFIAAGKGAHVLAVEADPYLANLLLRSKSISANRYLKIDVLTAAISDRQGISRLRFSPNGRAGNALAEVSSTQPGRQFLDSSALVATTTLDGLLELSMPSFVKIDIEGAELLAFQGGAKLLSDVRPVIYFECYKEIAQPISELLRKHRYSFYDSEHAAPRQPISTLPYNVLAIPE